jgi:hypothetical protein
MDFGWFVAAALYALGAYSYSHTLIALKPSWAGKPRWLRWTANLLWPVYEVLVLIDVLAGRSSHDAR